jgi:hypothetical protein
VLTNAATFTPDNVLQGTLATKEQPALRVSRVQTYFGQINPLLPLTQVNNFRSMSVAINAAAEANYGAQAIQTIYSRWIPQLGRTVADRLGALILGRFSDPPRHVSFSMLRYAQTDVTLGTGYQVQSKFIQDATGAPSSIPVQVTQLNPAADSFVADAEEMLFNAPVTDLTNRSIVIDANNYNINLRAAHDSIFPVPTAGITVTFTLNAGVTVGSHATATPAIDVGLWPAGVTINLIVLGTIQGMGGAGGIPGTAGPNAGKLGGPALFTRNAINLTDLAGKIWGGGGGGGAGISTLSGGGGGGAGQDAGPGGVNPVDPTRNGSPGTEIAGGAALNPGGGNAASGNGGGPGVAGGAGNGAGGAAGAAIDGISYVTLIGGAGDIRGPQIN